jgi:hypothetical protein
VFRVLKIYKNLAAPLRSEATEPKMQVNESFFEKQAGIETINNNKSKKESKKKVF